MKYEYVKSVLIGKNSFTYEGNGEIIDGNNKYCHLLNIHDCENLTVKGVTFQNGNTSLIRNIPMSNIAFRLPKMSIFEILDGGAVVITGSSSVLFEDCKFINNDSIMCGGAVSNQSSEQVSFYNCLFENNSAGHTGSAVDNLTNKATLCVDKCSFINNRSNVWHKAMSPHGQVSVFPNTKAKISNCSFENGSIPIDYVDKNSVVMENNRYIGFNNWEDSLKNRKSSNLVDSVRIMRKLYWIVPKTIGKVYYRVNY